jgi:ABC-type methionine transport system permease subunit
MLAKKMRYDTMMMMTRKSVMLTTVVGRLAALLVTMTRKKHDAKDKEEPRMVSRS